jgi:hypothetical protein
MSRRMFSNEKCLSILALLRGATDNPLPVLLARDHKIAVYCMDARGFGQSGGEAHKIKSKSWMFKDLRAFVCLLRLNHPELPLFLGNVERCLVSGGARVDGLSCSSLRSRF